MEDGAASVPCTYVGRAVLLVPPYEGSRTRESVVDPSPSVVADEADELADQLFHLGLLDERVGVRIGQDGLPRTHR